MLPWSVGGQLLCWCKCFIPWLCQDYWLELEPEYWDLIKYVVPTLEDHEKLEEKKPKRNFKQLLCDGLKPIFYRVKNRDPEETETLVQWFHKSELIRIISHAESGDGCWETDRPHCWDIPWKCIVLFAMRNKYGRYHYTMVDACTLDHEDGAESEIRDWKNHVFSALQRFKPLRVYAVNCRPFDVLNRDYYTAMYSLNFLEVYLKPEEELKEILLKDVWQMFLTKVKFMLYNMPKSEYSTVSPDVVNFNVGKVNEKLRFPSRLKFLERFEKEPSQWVCDELKQYIRWKLYKLGRQRRKVLQENQYFPHINDDSRKLIRPVVTESLFILQTNFKFIRNSRKLSIKIPRERETNDLNCYKIKPKKRSEKYNSQKDDLEDRSEWLSVKEYLTRLRKFTELSERTDACTNGLKKSYSEYLWKREKYLKDVEKTGIHFPGVLYFNFNPAVSSYLLNCGWKEMEVFLKYWRYWAKWAPLLIFDDLGNLYADPAKRITALMNEKLREENADSQLEELKLLPKTRAGTLYTEVGLPINLRNSEQRNITVNNTKFRDIKERWKSAMKSHFPFPHAVTARGVYWQERKAQTKTQNVSFWAGRKVDRIVYGTGIEWFQYKYPTIFANVNDKWQELVDSDWLKNQYRPSTNGTKKEEIDYNKSYGLIPDKIYSLSHSYSYNMP